jgi:hypothetical protein
MHLGLAISAKRLRGAQSGRKLDATTRAHVAVGENTRNAMANRRSEATKGSSAPNGNHKSGSISRGMQIPARFSWIVDGVPDGIMSTVTIEDVDRAALRLAARSRLTVLPICGATKDGGYDAIGSGILVRFEDRPCLATAKHVLDYNDGDIYDPLNNPTTLYVGNPAGGSCVELTGEATRCEDPYDVALVELSVDTQIGLWDCEYLNPDIDFSQSTLTVKFGMAMGYPVGTVKKDETSLKVRHDPLIYSNAGCDWSGNCVRIPVDPRRAVSGNTRYDIGALNGISGGGVFWLRSVSEPEAADHLAGIITEYDPDSKRLFATDVNSLRRLFAKLSQHQL